MNTTASAFAGPPSVAAFALEVGWLALRHQLLVHLWTKWLAQLNTLTHCTYIVAEDGGEQLPAEHGQPPTARSKIKRKAPVW